MSLERWVQLDCVALLLWGPHVVVLSLLLLLLLVVSSSQAHSFLGGVGFGVLFPLGALVTRHLEPWAPLWYALHIGAQACGYAAGVAGRGLGLWLKAQAAKERDLADAPGYEQAHYGIGVAVFCAATVQVRGRRLVVALLMLVCCTAYFG